MHLGTARGARADRTRHRFSRFDTLPFGGGLLLQASLSLARLEATSGAPARAIRVLEEADNDRSRACGWFQSGGYLWVRQRAELARLYAHVGRRREAERVAAQVRSLMALADEDHPLKNFQVSD